VSEATDASELRCFLGYKELATRIAISVMRIGLAIAKVMVMNVVELGNGIEDCQDYGHRSKRFILCDYDLVFVHV